MVVNGISAGFLMPNRALCASSVNSVLKFKHRVHRGHTDITEEFINALLPDQSPGYYHLIKHTFNTIYGKQR